jgi:hypothetical protein
MMSQNKYKPHASSKETERRRRQIESGQLTESNGLRVIRFDGSHSFDQNAYNAKYYQENRERILADKAKKRKDKATSE